MLQTFKCDRKNDGIGIFATTTFCQKRSNCLDIWPSEAGCVSTTPSSDKELLSCMGRSQKGLDIWPSEAGCVSTTPSSDEELLSCVGRSQKGLINPYPANVEYRVSS